MKASFVLISSLIFTFSIACNATIQSWCANTPDPAACIAPIQSNPRSDLKNTPQGAAFIHVGAAQANVRSTVAFINEHIKSEKYEDVLNRLTGCLRGYNSIKSYLDFSLASLDTPQGRSDAISKLDETDEEVTYDCGWQTLIHTPPVVKQLEDRVQSFSDSVSTARAILHSIDQLGAYPFLIL